MYICSKCGKEFECWCALGGHVQAIHTPKRRCEFCGRYFGCANINKHMAACPENPANQYECANPNCNKVIAKGKFCSSSCAAIYNNPLSHKKPAKFCGNCGQELIGRNKKYCSTQCLSGHRYKVHIQQWLQGEIDGLRTGGRHPKPSRNVRWYLLERAGSQCERCGWNEKNPYTEVVPLEIHHIDGKWENNRPENLVILCPNCHALTEYYKNNQVRGRRGGTRGGV